ncbi:MAG: malto-oligosyltrehalose synthase [Gammaproteobacteria bacterium]|nr:malto-oligosyltrehalose synthase [Gammaproteobacteria bacterium]NIR83555.1 malto-oligosyltrehalose synthase [Gammaproteobacteria bacterium]NIR91477.1 malto-oligosyltrehalose synthase [Gammaproteobacteria bacterium]NIU04717.1 malto-oligosyltrehalose synthase [Gammaproteobacteria bacterium]NIV51759.1 malto-oligosyltrehalose synthase [Gammaproteobacteria bacterium]
MNVSPDKDKPFSSKIPTATYRLQLNGDFNFDRAAAIVDYLSELGISHAYASPYLKARPGSTHGYDIIDHNAFNPEIGSRDGFERFVACLRKVGMGHILDLVPNHMGVGSDNAWWMDVLEHGEASAYAPYFDIDWRPEEESLRGKVLLPVLTDHYGTRLENGAVTLAFDAQAGEFRVQVDGQCFPVDPGTYGSVLAHRLEVLEQELGRGDSNVHELQSLITSFRNLPTRGGAGLERQAERARDSAGLKRRLAELCAASEVVSDFVNRNVADCNGERGEPASFDRLHELLEQQAYRLAYWRVAADEINYRRFFDINDLAGLRMEVPAAFEATHALVLGLVSGGRLDGLRIDHPDGLFDPAAYYARLRDRLRTRDTVDPRDGEPSCYVVVEKILASHETLREDWPVHGTTGYDFANEVNGLFVYPGSAKSLDRLYARFTGSAREFDEVAYERKKLITRTQLSSELTVLTHLVHAIAKRDRYTRDFTRDGVRDALTEIVACFPVYRTYVTGDGSSEADRRCIGWAVAEARRRSPASDIDIFDFLRDVLMLRVAEPDRDIVSFVMKFQQYTAPVMAKGIEDTAFYDYNRLLSLNEVGGDPNRFGVSADEFHRANGERARCWPHAMLTTSTHDTKRSEDVRARLNVLTEIPALWRRHVARWRRINRPRKRIVQGREAPTRNDEYHFYQCLVGVWPLRAPGASELGNLRDRVERYMLKAVREAKVRTSWINPNRHYEEAVSRFVHRVLARPERNAFLQDFIPFQRQVARIGLYNSLAQTLLKLTAPGVPDIYQGNELPVFSLVDPDNRNPVDYDCRRAMLEEVRRSTEDETNLAACAKTFADEIEDGRAKLYLTWRTLALRRRWAAAFARGDYVPLRADGSKAEHLFGFARVHGGRQVIVVVPRWLARLAGDREAAPVDAARWSGTWIVLDRMRPGADYRNVLTGERVQIGQRDGAPALAAVQLFAHFPVALLVNPESS